MKDVPGTEQQWQMVLDNQKLIYHLLQVYLKGNYRQFIINNYDDLVQECYIAMLKAAQTYDASKAQFSTYAGICVSNCIKMAMRRYKNTKGRVSSLDEAYRIDDDGKEYDVYSKIVDESVSFTERVEDMEIVDQFYEFIDGEDQRTKALINFRFKEDKPQYEVADLLGISRSYVNRLEHKILKRGADYIKGENLKGKKMKPGRPRQGGTKKELSNLLEELRFLAGEEKLIDWLDTQRETWQKFYIERAVRKKSLDECAKILQVRRKSLEHVEIAMLNKYRKHLDQRGPGAVCPHCGEFITIEQWKESRKNENVEQ